MQATIFIYFNDLGELIEIYIYARKKHTFTSYSAAKHPKHSKFAITDIPDQPVNLFIVQQFASVSTISLLTQVPLQKFPFLFIIIISWVASNQSLEVAYP